MKKYFFLPIILSGLLLVSCNNTPSNNTPKTNDDGYVSIAVDTNPSKLSYTVGEYFEPAGLVVTLTDKKGDTTDVTYSDTNKNEFTFNPSLTTALALTNDKVTVTYEKLSTDINITVSEAAAGNVVTVDFADCPTGDSNDDNFGGTVKNFMGSLVSEVEFADKDESFVQVQNNEQKIEGRTWYDKVMVFGSGSATSIRNGEMTLTFAKKLLSVTINARGHAKFYKSGSTYGLSADTNPNLYVGEEIWQLPTVTTTDYEVKSRVFNVNASTLKISTAKVEKQRVWIFSMTLTFEE